MTDRQQKRDGAEPVSESKRANAMRSIATPSKQTRRNPQEEAVIQRAIDAPGSLSAHEVLQLQQTIGNRAVQRLLSQGAPRLPQRNVQAKLTVGPANDRYEQEADLVAAQVINRLNTPLTTPNAGQNIQRQQTEEDEELKRKPLVQLQSVEGGMDVSSDLEASIQAARGGGQPLNKNVRTSMESAFGADFSGVKVHSDAEADMLNRSIQARAFTTGQDIFFRHGEYNPDSDEGKHLIAHELTHVIQQNKSTTRCQNQVSQRKASLRSASREPFIEVSKTVLATIQRMQNTSSKPGDKWTTLTNVSPEIPAGDVLSAYGQDAGFPGAYNPETGQWVALLSDEATLNGAPITGVQRLGGHRFAADILREKTENSDIGNYVAFTLKKKTDKSLEIRWNSYSINEKNWGDPGAPEKYRKAICEAVKDTTGFEVKE